MGGFSYTKTGGFALAALMIIPIVSLTIDDAYSLRQVAGQILIELKPGESETFEWGLASDDKNEITVVELSAEGDGSEFLSFPKTLEIDPGKTIFTKVTVSIPPDYPGGIELTPHLIATEFGEQGGATIINIRMLKIVNLDVALNDDESLHVDWDKLKGKAEPEPAPVEEQEIPEEDEQQGFQVLKQDEEPQTDPEPVEEQGTDGGGCLIATATFGSELAPQVQLLREVRDNILLTTDSGSGFMSTFNQLYYSFSPTIADLERQSPIFKETVKLFITPMISSLSIMSLAEADSEASVISLGISVIAMNLGLYIAAPAIAVREIKKRV